MEGRHERDPGYDDWFDEPEPPTETQSAASRSLYEDAEDVWMLPEEDAPTRYGRREIGVAGTALTTSQVAIIGVAVLAVIFAILAAVGVFNGSAANVPPVTLGKKPPPVTTQASTQAVVPPAAQAPAQTLKPGDQGAQVKLLQRALAKLGYSPGKADGDYGIATKVAVERFQLAKHLGEDGILGPQTLGALRQALSSAG